MLSQSAVNLS